MDSNSEAPLRFAYLMYCNEKLWISLQQTDATAQVRLIKMIMLLCLDIPFTDAALSEIIVCVCVCMCVCVW